MRKSFKHILLAGLTIASTAMAMNAQTLTQDWKVTEGLPTAGNARWGIGFDGKVFVNDMTAQKIASFDGTNKNTLEVGAAGVCTSVDSKGNLLVANLWKWGGKMTSLKIWNKTTGVISEFEVTIPESVTSTSRMDVFGKVVGDITSETGGAVFFCPSDGNKIVKLFFANSAQVVEKSKVIETTFANFQTTCIAQPLTNDPESDAIILKDKGVKEVYVFDGTNWTTLENAGVNGSTGIDAVTLNGTQYTIEPTGVDFTDGFQIVDRSTNTVVATHAAEGVEDYKVDSNDKGGFYGGGGIRFNADFSLLAIGTSDKTLTVFEVSKDDNGAPVLTEKYKFATTIGRNLNDIAWDCANNLYIVSNSGELLKTVALPRENGEVVVAAPSKYDINISSDEYPASVYIIGSNNVWNPEDGVKLTKGENGVYTGTLTGPCNFGITTVLNADWDVVNANRYGFEVDNAAVTLNQAMPIVKAAGAIRVAEEGEFELTVDLKNMTVLVAGEAPVVYPEKLYLLGNVEPNAWDPADETHVANPISEGIYQIDNVSILAADENDYGYFAFTSTPGTWDDVNAHRYGPAVKDTELADKTMSAIGLNGDTSYKIKSGAYSITVDLGLNTIYAVRLGDNVNDAAVEAAKVVAGIGEIRIIGEANAVSIFNAAGQAVAVNSKDAQFFVASGIYVVVVDGKTTKVLVK